MKYTREDFIKDIVNDFGNVQVPIIKICATDALAYKTYTKFNRPNYRKANGNEDVEDANTPAVSRVRSIKKYNRDIQTSYENRENIIIDFCHKHWDTIVKSIEDDIRLKYVDEIHDVYFNGRVLL